MRVAVGLLSLASVVGCAKFPSGSSNRNLTRIHFDFTFAAPVVTDRNYVYIVAIRPILSDPDLTRGPIPVVDPGSKNGFVAGRPTLFVRFDPSSLEKYSIYRFASETSEDPADPGLVGSLIGQPLPGSGIDPVDPAGSNGDKLGFDIDTAYLVEDQTQAQSIISFQFNILSMNKTILSSGDQSGRVMDALGDQSSRSSGSFNNPRLISLNTGGDYGNSRFGGSFMETKDDTFGGTLPSIDLIDWNVSVRLP